MSTKKLLLLTHKIADIGFALLRFEDRNKQKTLQVRITVNDDHSLNCVVMAENCDRKLINKNVHLIQKHNHDYMHITGKVSREIQTSRHILCLQISRISWFVRTTKGNISWLRQKYCYDVMEEKKLMRA